MVDICRDVLVKEGYRITMDSTAVLYDLSNEDRQNERWSDNGTNPEENTEESDWCSEDGTGDAVLPDDDDWDQDVWEKDGSKSNQQSGFIHKNSMDFFTSTIGEMTLDDYEWCPDDYIASLPVTLTSEHAEYTGSHCYDNMAFETEDYCQGTESESKEVQHSNSCQGDIGVNNTGLTSAMYIVPDIVDGQFSDANE